MRAVDHYRRGLVVLATAEVSRHDDTTMTAVAMAQAHFAAANIALAVRADITRDLGNAPRMVPLNDIAEWLALTDSDGPGSEKR